MQWTVNGVSVKVGTHQEHPLKTHLVIFSRVLRRVVAFTDTQINVQSKTQNFKWESHCIILLLIFWNF